MDVPVYQPSTDRRPPMSRNGEGPRYPGAPGSRSLTEVYPLERAAEAYDRMMSGKARFRVVLPM